MFPIIDVARRPRGRAGIAAVAALGAIAIAHPDSPTTTFVCGTIAPHEIRVDDPPAPAALPAWATRPDHPARHVAGRVVGEHGEPIPAIVHLRLETNPELWRGLDVATDARGRFDFGIVPAAAYHAIAEAPGLGSRVASVRTDGGAGNEAQDGGDVELILHACEHVRGVVTSGGVPVIGARIAHGGVALAHSGAGGRFELCATEPWLDVRAPTLALAKQFVDIDHGEVIVQLWPTQRFAGRVVDEHGAPRAGISIVPTISDRGPREYSPGASAATTAVDGTFTLDLPDPHARVPGAAALARRYMIWANVFDRFDTILYMEDAIAGEPMVLTLTDDQLVAPDPHVVVAHVRGRVIARGGPLADGFADITSQHRGQFTRTRADGSFDLALEAEQLGDLELSAGEDEAHAITRRIHVRAGQRVELGTLAITH